MDSASRRSGRIVRTLRLLVEADGDRIDFVVQTRERGVVVVG